MKTLVIQLARLGDILQTWPTLRAIRRTEPMAELHVLARGKFRSALDGLSAIDRIWEFDSRVILEPLASERPEFEESLKIIDALCERLRSENFGRIFNLSFSPLSSYLVDAIAGPDCDVRGYTRTSDGFLRIPDDPSAYFYAQVGPTRHNRVHLLDLFAHIAGVELAEEDLNPPFSLAGSSAGVKFQKNAIVIHAGASQRNKTLDAAQWSRIAAGLLDSFSGDVVLIGSPDEEPQAKQIMDSFLVDDVAVKATRKTPVNLVGKTSFNELFLILADAQLLIGGDSGPMHVATLLNVPVLNVSFPTVSFWETGPRSVGSRVVRVDGAAALPTAALVDEALSMVAPSDVHTGILSRTLCTMDVESRLRPYQLGPIHCPLSAPTAKGQFEWSLICALYMGGEFPAPVSKSFLVGIDHLTEINELALSQLASLARPTRTLPQQKLDTSILDRVDELIVQVGACVPELMPLIRWFQTERLRIGPGPVSSLIKNTEIVHGRLGQVLEFYRPTPPASIAASTPGSSGNSSASCSDSALESSIAESGSQGRNRA